MICIPTTRTSCGAAADTIILAFCTIGPRYGRKITQILARRSCLYVGGSRQVHQMGRSSPDNNPRFHISNQLHQVYSISLRSTTQHHHGQWDKLHIEIVQKLLREYRNQTEIRVCSASKDKRTSRESQWLNMQRDKKEAISAPGESQTRLGRRVTLRTLES
jgi:hypothetical protein